MLGEQGQQPAVSEGIPLDLMANPGPAMRDVAVHGPNRVAAAPPKSQPNANGGSCVSETLTICVVSSASKASNVVVGAKHSGNANVGISIDVGGFDAKKTLQGISNEPEGWDTDEEVNRWMLENVEEDEEQIDDHDVTVLDKVQVIEREGCSTRSTSKKKGKTKVGFHVGLKG